MIYEFIKEVDIDFSELYKYALDYEDSNITCDDICNIMEHIIYNLYGISPWDGDNDDTMRKIVKDFKIWSERKLLK